MDTGIDIHRVEFRGRPSWREIIPQNDVDEDANGHGAHYTGTISSWNYGVAKAVDLVAVKVLDSNGSGTVSDITPLV